MFNLQERTGRIDQDWTALLDVLERRSIDNHGQSGQ
jgi:hypothetical protein